MPSRPLTSDRALTIALGAEASRLAQDGAATADSLVTMAKGRGDLLAELAGIALGTYTVEPAVRPWALDVVRLLLLAGADVDALPAWVDVGRQRAGARAADGPAYAAGMRLTIDIDLEALPDPKGVELGRILRYWGGAAKDLDLTAPLEYPLMDSGYQQVGTMRVG